MDDKKNNATCKICGKEYYSCLSCNDQKRLYPWKMYTDTSEHYKIFQIIHGYSIGLYDKKEAKEKLDNVDLSDLNSFRDNIKNVINGIRKKENHLQEDVVVNSPIKEENSTVDVNNKNQFNKKREKFVNENKNIMNDTKDSTDGNTD